MNEQGALQGALASIVSLAGIVGPPVVTGLFSYFISPSAPVQLPGVAFFFGSFLVLCALVLTRRSFKKNEIHFEAAKSPAAAAPAPEASQP